MPMVNTHNTTFSYYIKLLFYYSNIERIVKLYSLYRKKM
jgi:hypothetical protein